jgi:hypothetical protein
MPFFLKTSQRWKGQYYYYDHIKKDKMGKAHMVKTMNVCKILVGKPERKEPPGRPRQR